MESVYATGGEVGGWALTDTMLSATGIELDSANSRIRVYNGSNYITMDADGIIGYDSVLGIVFQVYTDGTLPYFQGSVAIPTGETLTITDTAVFLAGLGLTPGSDVQEYDAFLESIAALGTGADKIIYTTAVNTAAEATLSAYARTLLDDANAAAARTTLGLGTIATQNAYNVTITGGSITGLTELGVDGPVGIDVGSAGPAYLLDIGGEFAFTELSADPDDPAEGKTVFWQSDGTGTGDDGDFMIKITAGSVTKTAVLVDFSGL